MEHLGISFSKCIHNFLVCMEHARFKVWKCNVICIENFHIHITASLSFIYLNNHPLTISRCPFLFLDANKHICSFAHLAKFTFIMPRFEPRTLLIVDKCSKIELYSPTLGIKLYLLVASLDFSLNINTLEYILILFFICTILKISLIYL